MTLNLPNLKFGYFLFNDPTLLLAVDMNALELLQKLFRQNEPFFLKSDCGERDVTLKFVRSTPPSTLYEENGNFTFALDEATASDIWERLHNMKISNTPCHNYLDPEINSTSAEIIVSLEEYGPDWNGWTCKH